MNHIQYTYIVFQDFSVLRARKKNRNLFGNLKNLDEWSLYDKLQYYHHFIWFNEIKFKRFSSIIYVSFVRSFVHFVTYCCCIQYIFVTWHLYRTSFVFISVSSLVFHFQRGRKVGWLHSLYETLNILSKSF